MVLDSSGVDRQPIHCLIFASGKLSFALPRLPAWAFNL
jgi:hypothetical protein